MAEVKEETKYFYPTKEFVEQAYVSSREEYEAMWKQSVYEPEEFWGNIASELTWFKKWLKVNREDFSKGQVEWFIGGKTNISYNCLDAQIKKGRGDKVAIRFQGELALQKKWRNILTYPGEGECKVKKIAPIVIVILLSIAVAGIVRAAAGSQ